MIGRVAAAVCRCSKLVHGNECSTSFCSIAREWIFLVSKVGRSARLNEVERGFIGWRGYSDRVEYSANELQIELENTLSEWEMRIVVWWVYKMVMC